MKTLIRYLMPGLALWFAVSTLPADPARIPSPYPGPYEHLACLNPQMPEAQRIQLHFTLLIEKLKARDTSHLTPAQRIAREDNLQALARYRDGGIFPRNDYVQGREPVFRDRRGTWCAVGWLIARSGHADVAAEIDRNQKFAYVDEITHPAVSQWIKNSGLTLEECLMIQPAYGACLPLPCPMDDSAAPAIEAFITFDQANPTDFILSINAHEPVSQVAAVLHFNNGKTVSLTNFNYWPVYTSSRQYSTYLEISGTAYVKAPYVANSDIGSALLAVGAINLTNMGSFGDCHLPAGKLLDAGMIPDLVYINDTLSSSCSGDSYAACYLERSHSTYGRLPFPCSDLQRIVVKARDLGGRETILDQVPRLYAANSDGSLVNSGLETARGRVSLFGWAVPNTDAPYAGYYSACAARTYSFDVIPKTESTHVYTKGGKVSQAIVGPNPTDGHQAFVSVELDGGADEILVQAYSAGMSLLVEKNHLGPFALGWNRLPVDISSAASGFVFLKVIVTGKGGGPVSSRVSRLYIVR